MKENTESMPRLTPRKIIKIMHDPVASAEAVNLVYITDRETQGIVRKPYGKKFHYYFKKKRIKEKESLKRFANLVLPPAWKEVWISPLENSHLQATGLDAKGRKQYRYHAHWNSLRNQTKFYRMLEFGNALPKMRLALEQDLSRKNDDRRKILAVVVSLMERTNIRVGNAMYEKLYGSFGLTTLKDRHVKVKGDKIRFSFKGKKGVYHDIELKSRKLAKLVENSKEIPGKELFQYFDEQGKRHSIDSGMVNEYIREISGHDFTAKDFRTWAGTVNALMAFREIGTYESDKDLKQKLKTAFDRVAEQLGNTATVTKKYYVHPLIVNVYENNTIKKYLDELEDFEVDDGKASLTPEEKMVMAILENETPTL